MEQSGDVSVIVDDITIQSYETQHLDYEFLIGGGKLD